MPVHVWRPNGGLDRPQFLPSEFERDRELRNGVGFEAATLRGQLYEQRRRHAQDVERLEAEIRRLNGLLVRRSKA